MSSATKLPRPGTRTTRPSSASRCIALRAVIRLTPNSSHSAVSDGSGSPGARPWIRSRRVRSIRRQCGIGGAAVMPAAASAPCTAAPIAPAQTPSSAGTTVTASSEVVRTRRSSSARIGANSSSPAAATPPPITTRSGEITVIMFAIPMPR